MITFLLAWCAVSVVGTLIALALIRAGKRRQPEADDIESPAGLISVTADTLKS